MMMNNARGGPLKRAELDPENYFDIKYKYQLVRQVSERQVGYRKLPVPSTTSSDYRPLQWQP
jgi:hypothetical protein